MVFTNLYNEYASLLYQGQQALCREFSCWGPCERIRNTIIYLQQKPDIKELQGNQPAAGELQAGFPELLCYQS